MSQSAADLRILLALLIYEGAPDPLALWTDYKDALCRDVLPLIHPSLADAPLLVRVAAEQATLDELDRNLSSFGLSNRTVGLPAAANRTSVVEDELAFFAPIRHRLRNSASERRSQLTPQQNGIRQNILSSIYSPEEAIVDELRLNGQVVTVCGATGLSASAFLRGSTVHKCFGIPVQDDDDDTVSLQSLLPVSSKNAQFLKECVLIVIHEIWALPRIVIDAVDQFLRNIMSEDTPFGGKCIVAVGDPRQTSPVTKENTRQSAVEASFLSSLVFNPFNSTSFTHPNDKLEILILQHGSTTLATITPAHPSILPICSLPSTPKRREFLFPPDILANPSESVKRCFLTRLNINVDEFNAMVLQALPGNTYTKHLFSAHSEAKIDTVLNTLARASPPYGRLRPHPTT
ncbi:hypothetical protein A4X09_0g7454 [Tilletia walkeri]|uniref:ATP-dependent DNA helicase n=1 Tax=Tilletia walkeri TaxID=117179 RepID=A0A8X7T1B7_9BASI|nr:hypothetical protein A4X09_0g7454 [Tilletia walkeri]